MYIYLRTFSNTAIPCSAQLTDICTYAYTHIYMMCMYITTHIYFHTSLLVALYTGYLHYLDFTTVRNGVLHSLRP